MKKEFKLITIEPGYAAIVNRDIDFTKDINFKRFGKTWFGRNILNINCLTFKRRQYFKDEILWIQSTYKYVFSKYTIGNYYNNDIDPLDTTLYEFQNFNNTDFLIFRLSIITSLYEQGAIDIVKYDNIKNNKMKDTFESLLLFSKIANAISQSNIYYNGENIISIKLNENYLNDLDYICTIKTVNKNDQLQTPYKFKMKDLTSKRFYTLQEIITGNPFDLNFIKKR